MHVCVYIYIYIYINGLCVLVTQTYLNPSKLSLKHTHGRPAGFLFPEADGHDRVRLQRASRWLFTLEPKMVAGIVNDMLICVHRVPRVKGL